MLLSSLLVLVRDRKVIHNSFLRNQLNIRNVVEVRTYNCGLLVVQVGLILLDALLASEENESVPHVKALLFWGAAFLQNFVLALVRAVLVATMVRVQLGIRAFGNMARQTQSVNLNFLAFSESGRTCDRKSERLGLDSSLLKLCSVIKPLGILTQLKESVGRYCAV
jgi:hypothetical protein